MHEKLEKPENGAIGIADIDQILEELDQLANEQESSRSRFLHAVLERLRFVLQCESTAFVVQSRQHDWFAAATSGPASPVALMELTEAGEHSCFVFTSQKDIAVPIRPQQWHSGVLLASFANPIAQGMLEDLAPLISAFAEIISTRQLYEIEQLLENRWATFQEAVANLVHSPSYSAGACSLVNDITAAFGADRVSLVKQQSHRMRVLAVSGTGVPKQNARAVTAIAMECQQCLKHGSTLTSYDPPKEAGSVAHNATDKTATAGIQDELLPNRICVPLSLRADEKHSASAALLVEWQRYDDFSVAPLTLNYMLPTVIAAWRQHTRWHRVPGIARSLATARTFHSLGILKAIRWSIAAALLAILGWALCRPTTLRIEAKGALQPADQKIVFAPRDGVVKQVLVADGQTVEKGQVLVKTYSPLLEVEIQGLEGDIRANREKHNGLQIAVNQLDTNTAESAAIQSRLSAEIRELDTKLESLNASLLSLHGEEQKLTIRAPIAGTIVAREIERNLTARPIKRGDGLLRVVRIDGPWRLELEIRDNDAGYVRRKMHAGQSLVRADPEVTQVQYTLSSRPEEKLTANAIWLSNSTHNVDGNGNFVDMYAEVQPQNDTYMGSSATAFIDCGLKPRWFVWSRPLIEAVQQRLWF